MPGGADSLSSQISQNRGLGGATTTTNVSTKFIYSAIVVPRGDEDPAEQNRIRARIVTLDEGGKIKGRKSEQDTNYDNYSGKDKNVPDNSLPWCKPLIPEFLHVRPQVGEMVWVLLSNPLDPFSGRFWAGPVITTKLKLKFQAYEDAMSIFQVTNFIPDKKTQSKVSTLNIYPDKSDVALQGRDDADLILRPREAILIAGKFFRNTLEPNTETPANLQIIQIENPPEELETDNEPLLERYSQSNLISTNVNLYSPRGKFRGNSIKEFEINEDLKSFNELANSLHPVPFGDELIRILDLIVKVLISHTHTPQKAAITNALTKELQKYTIDGQLQNIISNHIRIN